MFVYESRVWEGEGRRGDYCEEYGTGDGDADGVGEEGRRG